MANISPFSCFRPARALARRFVQKPSDFSLQDRGENMKKLLGKSVYSISQPQLFDLTYEDGKRQFSHLFKHGFIFPEINPAFYVYRITSGEHTQTGIVVSQALTDFEQGDIKMHEKTRTATRDYLYERLTTLRMNFTPIFSFYNDTEGIDTFIIENITQRDPDLAFDTPDGNQHATWKVDHEQWITVLESKLNSIKNIYLADGHHRLSVMGEVMEDLDIPLAKRRMVNILFPANQMQLFTFARVLRDIDQNVLTTFKTKMATNFEVANEPFLNTGFNYQIWQNGNWKTYCLKENKGQFSDDGIGYIKALDKLILEEIFSIINQEEDDRILFFKDAGEQIDVQHFTENIHADIAIRLKPISIADITNSADSGIPLPPKSTLFEPKPRSGLFITQI